MLLEAVASARRGRGRVVDLVGEPGIGKSRLLEEMMDETHASEADDEAAKLLTAARDASRVYEAGGGSAGDLAHAINCYRELYELLTTEELDPQQRASGTGRSA